MAKDSCAFSGYVNSIYTIAITGINSDGRIPDYGEHCAGIMAVTYSAPIYGYPRRVGCQQLIANGETDMQMSTHSLVVVVGQQI